MMAKPMTVIHVAVLMVLAPEGELGAGREIRRLAETPSYRVSLGDPSHELGVRRFIAAFAYRTTYPVV